MPEASGRDGEFSHRIEGVGATDERIVRSVMRKAGVPTECYEVVVGFYEPVRLTLEKFYPTMPPGGVVVLNDYGVFKGARDATDEFLREQGLDVEPVMIDPAGAFFQKPGEGFEGLPAAGHYPGWEGPIG